MSSDPFRKLVPSINEPNKAIKLKQEKNMILRLSILASAIAAAYGQATAPPDGCLICGDGQVITNPDGIFEFPGQPITPCDILQQAGLDGIVPLDLCPLLVPLIAVCECAPGDLPTEGPAPTDAPVVPPTAPPVDPPTPAPVDPTPPPVDPPTPPPVDPPTAPPGPDPTTQPVPAPTPAPAPTGGGPTPCPGIPDGGCSVCGVGMCVTNPDGIFVFPDQPTTPCGILEDAGFGGAIPLDQCPFLPGLVAEECGCDSEIPGDGPPVAPPFEPPTPGPPPVAPPTPRPLPDRPSDAPVPAPPTPAPPTPRPPTPQPPTPGPPTPRPPVPVSSLLRKSTR